MIEFILSIIRENPELIGLVLAMIAIWIGIRQFQIMQTNKFYEELEKSSLYQIEENLKNIERILSKTIGKETYTLQDILDGTVKPKSVENLLPEMQTLSPYFAEFCANLDKYHSNIMKRKKICFNFQEYGKKARKIMNLFKMCNYQDIAYGFAKLHLQSAGIINEHTVS